MMMLSSNVYNSVLNKMDEERGGRHHEENDSNVCMCLHRRQFLLLVGGNFLT